MSATTRLRLESLEARDVPAFVAVTTAAGNTVFTGNASADLLEIRLLFNGTVEHNRFAAGDAGFASAADFDSAQAGVQVFTPNSATKRIAVADAGKNDALFFNAGGNADVVDFDFLVQGTQSVLRATNLGSAQFFDLRWDAALREIRLRATNGPSRINVAQSAHAHQTLRLDSDGGNDEINIGGLVGTTDGLVSPVRVSSSGAGFATVTIDDSDAAAARRYIVDEAFTRVVRPGRPDLVVTHDQGDLEGYQIRGSDNADVFVVKAVPTFTGGTVTPSFFGNDGADVFTVRPDATDEIFINGGGGVVAPGDTLRLDLTGTVLDGPLVTPDGRAKSAGRQDVRYFGVETVVEAPVASAVSGVMFRDLNLNGIRDAGEPGLAGVTVFLDANGNNARDADEAFAVSNSAGAYLIVTDRTGAFQVRHLFPNSHTQTTNRRVVLTGGEVISGVNVGQLILVNFHAILLKRALLAGPRDAFTESLLALLSQRF